METQGRASVRFTLNGQRHELSREDVENCLADVAPDAIRKHAVRVNGPPTVQTLLDRRLANLDRSVSASWCS